MVLVIYRDDEASAVFVEDANGVQFLNSLQALSEILSDLVTVRDLARDIDIVTELHYSEFEDDQGMGYGSNATDVTNALNAVFEAGGSSTLELPVITSSLTVEIVEGESLNYELTADFGVGFEWENLPTGVVTVIGNVRKIIGGTGLTEAGSPYLITMRAVNYNGDDVETLTLTVTTPAFANTKAVKFNVNDFLNANADTSNPFYRPGNGSGGSDAWTLSAYFKPVGGHSSPQTLMMFGVDSAATDGKVTFTFRGNKDSLELSYGSDLNNLVLVTPDNSLPDGSWKHILVTYDGGTTGVVPAEINDYYGRFEIWIEGVSQTLSMSNLGDGFAGAVLAGLFRVARAGSGASYLRNGSLLDEIALWDSDQSANVAAIFNGGVPHDMALLGTPPTHWWRMGDSPGDIFPTLEDVQGTVDFTMFNMTIADIVSDVP